MEKPKYSKLEINKQLTLTNDLKQATINKIKKCYVRIFQQAKLQNPGKPRYIKTRRQVTKEKTFFKVKGKQFQNSRWHRRQATKEKTCF